jgi:transcriptional regulator with GAF, ATPase, and Fis domain
LDQKNKDALRSELKRLQREIGFSAQAEKYMEQIESMIEQTFQDSVQRNLELSALMDSSAAVLKHQDFSKSARAIFDHCRKLTGATSGYVALLDETGSENEVLFLESGGLPCTVDPSLPMPIRGLRAESYRTQKAVFDNGFSTSEWVGYLPGGHVELTNVMFAPLVIKGKAVGLLGLANKPGPFTEDDARMAAVFGELAAIALQNSKALEDRDRAEKEREKLIKELKEALANVKTLRGLLPICSSCKKVRDDQGYWKRIESYIQSRSDAEFTHGICPECMEKLYPEFTEELAKKTKGD